MGGVKERERGGGGGQVFAGLSIDRLLLSSRAEMRPK